MLINKLCKNRLNKSQDIINLYKDYSRNPIKKTFAQRGLCNGFKVHNDNL